MEGEEAEELEIRLQTLVDEVLFLGLCPPDPGLPADPPLLLLSSLADSVGSPQRSTRHRRDWETEGGRNRSHLSGPPRSPSSLHLHHPLLCLHHPSFPLTLQIPAELEPWLRFSGEPEH